MNEEPGTYFWHGHAGMEKVDSFFGPLIVHPPPGAPAPAQYDEERILLLSDNYHAESAPLTFALNRCADLPYLPEDHWTSRRCMSLQLMLDL